MTDDTHQCLSATATVAKQAAHGASGQVLFRQQRACARCPHVLHELRLWLPLQGHVAMTKHQARPELCIALDQGQQHMPLVTEASCHNESGLFGSHAAQGLQLR